MELAEEGGRVRPELADGRDMSVELLEGGEA